MTFCSVYLHRLRCQGSDLVVKTSRPSSAVADRPRDACLSVLASIVSYNTSSALFYYLFFSASSDLPVRAIRFCSVIYSVTSSLAVIHTDGTALGRSRTVLESRMTA